jgi:hypothetical protein
MNPRIFPVLFLFAFSLDAGLFTHKAEHTIDPALSAKLTSRIPCDGAASPEDHPIVKTSFPPGGLERSFTITTYQKGGCKFDAKVKCLNKEVEGFYNSWTVSSTAPALKADQVSLRSCYAWGSSEPAQYLLSAFVASGERNPKHPHKAAPMKQVAVKKTGSNPDVYEFSDPQGGNGRIELFVK